MSAFQVMEYQPGIYIVDTPVTDEDILEKSAEILLKRAKTNKEVFADPKISKRFLQNKMVDYEHEVFSVLFLDNRHQLIKYEEIFRGTIDGSSVYPREIVKLSLKYNAAALIISHNHPSGIPMPSTADEHITHRLKEALALVDIRLIDHIIIGSVSSEKCPGGIASLAELGLL